MMRSGIHDLVRAYVPTRNVHWVVRLCPDGYGERQQMSCKTVTFCAIICNRCGTDYHDGVGNAWDDEQYAREMAERGEWMYLNNEDICIDCITAEDEAEYDKLVRAEIKKVELRITQEKGKK